MKKLSSWLKSEVAAYDGFVLFPLVVVVNPLKPRLVGKSADTTVRHLDLIDHLVRDPRTDAQRVSAPGAGEAARPLFEYLRQSTVPPTTHLIGPYSLDVLEGSATTEPKFGVVTISTELPAG